ncbi:ATP-binding protein [Pleomorphomonas sp. PLEO]|uniref:ATP/GTP-binding protein n=1 Tax=Pleomorphomonas sp. PLEO TaxID=3239306 RepID=UPI00351E48EC
MRIAVTGTHGCGKTTLIDDFISAHGNYESVPEPYWLLAQNGMPFADGPTTADLEEQLGQSCMLLLEQAREKDLIFDRCPLDFIAYLDIVSASEGFEWLPQGRLLNRIAKALASLDLIVFVPLLRLDEIGVPIEYPQLRTKVDQRLKTMLRQDDLGLLEDGPRIVEVSGSRAERVARIETLLN